MPPHTSSIATSWRAGAAESPSNAATSASPTPSWPNASTGSDRRCATDSTSGRKSGSCCSCSTARRSPTASSARSRSARCRSRSTRSGRRLTTATLLDDSAARVVVVSDELLPGTGEDPASRAARPAAHVVVVGRRRRRVRRVAAAAASPTLDAHATSRDAPAFWLYSSGSTGRPKGCVHLQHDMVVCAELFAKGRARHHRGRSLLQRRQAVLRLRPGQRAVLPARRGRDEHSLARPAAARARVRRRSSGIGRRCSSRCRPATRCCWRTTAAIRPVVASGWRSRRAKRCRQRSTSASSSASASTSSTASDPPRRCTCSSRTGRARSAPARAASSSPATKRAFSTTTGMPVADGEIGNLWISGDSTCACYWNQHEKTKDTIQGEWLRTGDKYSQDADGYFWYAGRSDDMLKVGGHVGQPGRSRERAHRAPCGAGMRRRRPRGSRRARQAGGVRGAATGHQRDARSSASELQQFVRQRLAEYKRPRWVEFLPELPKTATGKIQRYRLRQSQG